MQQWTREDLPHWDTIRDADDMHGNGMRSRVIDIALDTIVEHLNERHPKSDLRKVEAQRDTQKTNARRARHARDKWKAAAETATSNAQMWMDEAVEQRERADEAERQRDDAHRVYAKVRGECDSWMTSNNNWKSRYDSAEQERNALDDRLAKVDVELSEALARAEKAEKQAAKMCRERDGWRAAAEHRGDLLNQPDPVEDKARELWMVMSGHDDTGDVFTWRNLEERHKVEFRRAARHVLGDAA